VGLITAPVVVIIGVVLFLTDGGGSASPRTVPAGAAPAQAAKADRFDSARAFAFLERQVKVYGERPAGSAASRKLAAELRRKLPHGRYESVPGGLRNVLGRIPGRKPAILVAAHYDTKAMPGFVGAEDAAGGTAAVVELARALKAVKRPASAPEIRFALFDGEECVDDSRDFYSCGLRGSRFHAARHPRSYRAVVLLDFVAQRDLSLKREDSSDLGIWGRLRAAARRVGSGDVFPDVTQDTVLDDHTPFLRRGVPAIDLIDFDFPCWHKTCDDLTAVSEASLDKSGEAVLELLRSWK
jgi:hypothetical protein